MDICSLHGPEMAYENESCPACMEIKALEKRLIAYEEELADYAKTVTRLNKEILTDNKDEVTLTTIIV